MGLVTEQELNRRLAISSDAMRLLEEQALAGRLALEFMHEIRNPLEALGHINFLTREDANQPDKVRSYTKLADEQIATVVQIANHTLGFARPCLTPKPYDLAQVAEAALRIHRRTISSKSVRLVKDFADGVFATMHVGEMLQVLSNLIVNALDALPTFGILHLRLRKRGSRLYFVIADNGHGIATINKDQIFRPFFTTKADRGTGLGLALSEKIIERHYGTIRMRSSVCPHNHGTTFRVCLPH
jgi:signal transduction histidine kinase